MSKNTHKKELIMDGITDRPTDDSAHANFLVAAFRSIHGVSLVAVSGWSHPFLLGPHPLTFLPHGIMFVFILGFFLPRPFASILVMVILVSRLGYYRVSFGVFSYLVWGILLSFGVFSSLVWGILVSRLGYSSILGSFLVCNS